MWIRDVFESAKDLWVNGAREVVIYIAIGIVFLMSGLLRKIYHSIKNAILSLFTVEGAISFIISAAAVIFFLTKTGIIKW
jgi:ABC-type spermidine/putrescine transport system permease subunit I